MVVYSLMMDHPVPLMPMFGTRNRTAEALVALPTKVPSLSNVAILSDGSTKEDPLVVIVSMKSKIACFVFPSVHLTKILCHSTPLLFYLFIVQ